MRTQAALKELSIAVATSQVWFYRSNFFFPFASSMIQHRNLLLDMQATCVQQAVDQGADVRDLCFPNQPVRYDVVLFLIAVVTANAQSTAPDEASIHRGLRWVTWLSGGLAVVGTSFVFLKHFELI